MPFEYFVQNTIKYMTILPLSIYFSEKKILLSVGNNG